MAADKDAAKRRRQARNRQEREQRQKRIEGAKRSAEARSRPSPTDRGSGSAGSGARATSSGGFLGRVFGPRPQPAAEGADGRPSRAQPARPADGDGSSSTATGSEAPRKGRPARVESPIVEVEPVGGLRGFVQRAIAQPGGRATLLALMMSLASLVTLLAFPVIPLPVLEGFGTVVIEDSGVTQASIEGRLERFEAADPVTEMVRFLATPSPVLVVLFAALPVLISVVAVRSLTSPTRSRTLLVSALAGAVYTFVSGAIGIYFFLGVVCLGWASFQSRKADAMVAAVDG